MLYIVMACNINDVVWELWEPMTEAEADVEVTKYNDFAEENNTIVRLYKSQILDI